MSTAERDALWLSNLFGEEWVIYLVVILIVSIIGGYIIAKKLDSKVNILVWLACSTMIASLLLCSLAFDNNIWFGKYDD